jgi:hypothetical protein
MPNNGALLSELLGRSRPEGPERPTTQNRAAGRVRVSSSGLWAHDPDGMHHPVDTRCNGGCGPVEVMFLLSLQERKKFGLLLCCGLKEY